MSGSSLGLTLNRGAGNISVPAVTLPTGGAKSVNVSTSGNNMTVNVDGHSDSATIINSLSASYSGSTLTINVNGRSTSTTVSGSGNRANLTGSLDLSKAVFTSLGSGGGDGTMVYRCFIMNDTPQTISGDVSVTGYMVDYPTNVQSDTGYPLGDVADYTYNLNGSGRIIVEAGVLSEKNIYTKSKSEWATIIFEVNSGEITQTSHNVSGVSRSETRFAIKSVQIST